MIMITGYQWLRRLVASLADFDQALKSQTTVKTRAEVERITITLTLAELNGVSLAPPGLSLRLLPFMAPHIYRWRRDTAGIKDATDEIKIGC